MEERKRLVRNPRAKALTKFCFDLLAIILIVISFFVSFFYYGEDFGISSMFISYRFEYRGLPAYVNPTFGTFERVFCAGESSLKGELGEICAWQQNLKAAGIIYAVGTGLTFLLLIYTTFNLIGLSFGCSCFNLLKVHWLHYILPIIYGLTVVIYVLVSSFYLFKTSGSDWTSEGVSLGVGMVLIIATEVIEIVGAIYFYWARRKGIEDLLLVAMQGYIPLLQEENKKDKNP